MDVGAERAGFEVDVDVQESDVFRRDGPSELDREARI